MSASDRLSLGFDTSAAHCAAALVSGDRILAHRVEAMRKGQAERLMPLLEELLAEAGRGWSDLDCIGVGTGPGNFTGIRIAVAAARGLALGLGVPALGVTGPEALAGGRDVIVCLPAPQGAVHVARGDDIRTLTAADWPGDWRAPLVGPEAAGLARALDLPLDETPELAPAIARIAAARARSGGPRPAPLYMRPADAAPPADRPPVIL